MSIKDDKLRIHVERVVALMTSVPAETRPVCGLLDGYHWFSLTDGETSPQACEALRLLLSEELRPAVRQWYQGCGDKMNEAALELRERLSKLAGERFA
jgi:hypothetical protein